MIVKSSTKITLTVKDIQDLLEGIYLKTDGLSIGIDFGTSEYEIVRSEYGKLLDE